MWRCKGNSGSGESKDTLPLINGISNLPATGDQRQITCSESWTGGLLPLLQSSGNEHWHLEANTWHSLQNSLISATASYKPKTYSRPLIFQMLYTGKEKQTNIKNRNYFLLRRIQLFLGLTTRPSIRMHDASKYCLMVSRSALALSSTWALVTR